MIKKVIFRGIKFSNFDKLFFSNIIKRKGLFVFPSGPGLSNINDDKKYLDALKKSDFVFFDSGYFVLLLKILKNINVKKFSGYLFLKLLFNYLKKNRKYKVLSVDPNLKFSVNNRNFFINLGMYKKNIFNYVSPTYHHSKIIDKKLLKISNKIKPDYIILNLGGGIQEILGLYLKKNLKKRTKIICTGAAISFFTRDQAPLNLIFDRFYFGWLIRIIFKPAAFLPRYIKTIKLFIIVLKEKIIAK